jgi:hypothetical protein
MKFASGYLPFLAGAADICADLQGFSVQLSENGTGRSIDR